MTQTVFIAHAPEDESLAESLAKPLRSNGYQVVHSGTIFVGDSLEQQASELICEGAPVVLCGTVKAGASEACARFVNAARKLHSGVHVYCVRVERNARIETFALDTKIAEFWENPEKALKDLILSLKAHHAKGGEQASPFEPAQQAKLSDSTAPGDCRPQPSINVSERKRRFPRKPTLLLVKPAIKYPVKNHDFGIPLGLWVLKSYLRRAGIDAEVLDERLCLLKGSSIPFEQVIESYDIIGFSACSCELPEALLKADAAKKRGKRTILGGIIASTNEQMILSTGAIDHVIPGVATRPLTALMRALASGSSQSTAPAAIPGVFSKDTPLPDLNTATPWWTDTLPSADHTTMDEIFELYAPHLNGKLDLITSRGCSQRCTFCSIRKDQARICHRNEADVIDDIIYAAQKGFTRISIKDEIFPRLLRRANTILRTAWQRTRALGKPMEFKIKSRVDTLWDHKDLIRKYYQWGVREIQFGVESIDASLLNIVHKDYRTKGADALASKLQHFFQAIAGEGIIVNLSLLLGIEGESQDHYQRLLNFFEKLTPRTSYRVYVNFFTPHPFQGTWQVPRPSRLLNNDLRCFTHKIPVMAPDAARTITMRTAMLEAYSAMTDLTQSHQYNPAVPAELKQRFIQGHQDLSGQPVLPTSTRTQ